MKERTKNQKEWLQEQNRDQNLQGLENLVNTEKNDEGRKWYPSQVIQPTVCTARYNAVSGFYELGCEDRNAMTIATSTASVATHDFVITNGQTWEIHSVGGSNQTQVSAEYVYYYDGTNIFPIKSSYSGGGTSVASTGGEGTYPLRFTGNGTVAIRVVFTVCNVGVDVMRAAMYYRRVQ